MLYQDHIAPAGFLCFVSFDRSKEMKNAEEMGKNDEMNVLANFVLESLDLVSFQNIKDFMENTKQNTQVSKGRACLIFIVVILALPFCLCTLCLLPSRFRPNTTPVSESIQSTTTEPEALLKLENFIGKDEVFFENNSQPKFDDASMDGDIKFSAKTDKYSLHIEFTSDRSTYAQARLETLECSHEDLPERIEDAFILTDIDETNIRKLESNRIHRFEYKELDLSVSCSRLDNSVLLTLIKN
ncbi:MAG: hypothetical protein TR69_WS6001000715 [candidate division WS6 bacterium OLB20]|uniref:Uncharacterized protein n=1 Tax=candidate division WS6 bacterium OLB20 TaxID=1617426 RepID=A0A136LYF3_9BACT|nr:MAG: hypothetical protein TR69_WS6001000715 [candidate division WS6 bacterium OLB20]